MAIAELEYNPYLLETKVRFNNREPYVNSLVEKYKNKRLEDWIDKLPGIFKDEMNGYHFTLEFCGTDLDFEKIKEAFLDQGINEDLVTCVHKKSIENRTIKRDEIRTLQNWFENNKNRTFDIEACKDENSDLFNDQFLVLVFHGDGQKISGSVNEASFFESVDSTAELDDVDLTHVPIIYLIDKDSMLYLQSDIQYMTNRHDIDQQQIFFMTSQALNTKKVERTIRDLGIAKPMMISDVRDKKLKEYCLIYPMTDYICLTINILRKKADQLKEQEEEKRKENEAANKEVYDEIAHLEQIIDSLKLSFDEFQSRDNLEIPSSWNNLKNVLMNKINNWKSRKIKTTDNTEAEDAAIDFNEKIHRFLNTFVEELKNEVAKFMKGYEEQYRSIYLKANQDTSFEADVNSKKLVSHIDLPNVVNDLMIMKTENYVTPKNDLFGMFFKQDINEQKPVLENTYSFQEWRNYISGILEPQVNQIISQWFDVISGELDELADKYQDHLKMLISEYVTKKRMVSSQLSEDEQRFQDDVNWLENFNDQLSKIERG